MKRTYLFDFDGVILDSEKFHYEAWKHVAGLVSVDFSFSEYVPFQSRGRKAVISYLLEKAKISFDEKIFNELSAEKSAFFARSTRYVGAENLIPGVADFIKKLKSLNFSLGLCSSAVTANDMLLKLGLARYFDVVFDGKKDLPKKPDPAVFLAASSFFGESPKNCVVFEDSVSGVTSALNGGFNVIGIGENLSFFEGEFPIFKDFIGVNDYIFGK